MRNKKQRLDMWIMDGWIMDRTMRAHVTLKRTMILKAREEEGVVVVDDDVEVEESVSGFGAPYQLRLRRV